MKSFLFLFISSFCVLNAHAGFDRASVNLGTITKNMPNTVKFIYSNSSKKPVILAMIKSSSELNLCKVTSYPQSPILPGKSGEVMVQCKFSQEGYNSKQVALVQVSEGTTRSTQSLTVQAQVIEHGTCLDMDLNYGATLSKMPMLDQDGLGTCYSYTSSQLIEFHLKQKGFKRSLSPIDASFIYKQDERASEFVLNSGVMRETIEEILDEGVASRECINRVIKKHTTGTTLTSEEFLTLIQDVYINRRQSLSEKQIKVELKSRCDSFGITVQQLDKLMKDLDKPFKKYLTSMFSECDKERDINLSIKQDYAEKSTGTDKEIRIYLNEVLDQRVPAAIALCAEIIQGDPTHRGLDGTVSRRLKKDKDGKNQCGNHSVLITAKRKVNDKCEYLVRNSWGGSWQGKGLTCACKTENGYYPDCRKAPAKAANKVMVGCWVSQTNLIPNISVVGGFTK